MAFSLIRQDLFAIFYLYSERFWAACVSFHQRQVSSTAAALSPVSRPSHTPAPPQPSPKANQALSGMPNPQ